MSRPLHVAHVMHSLGVGGLENGVINLVNRTNRDLRHSIVSLTPDAAWRPRLDPAVEVVTLRKTQGHDLRTFAALVRCLRRAGPAVVHSRNWAAFDAVLAARLARVPVVVHGEHGRDITDPEGTHRRRNRLRRLLSPLVDRFVAVSHDLRRWLVTEVGIPARKVVTIHNGVDTVRFAPADGSAARARLGIATDRPVVGTVGRLDPVKDQAGLVRAFARVRRQHPDAMLVIAGDGPCRGELETLVGALELESDALLLGMRSDVPTLLQAMDVFVLPSIAEGVSNTLLEALATGLPVVATRVGGNPELVEDGVNGLLVPRRDPEALAAAIATYLGAPHVRTIHGKASRQRALDQFDLDTMSTVYAGLYRDAARA